MDSGIAADPVFSIAICVAAAISRKQADRSSALGSLLDSILEIVDAKGASVERATVRCVLETSTTLFDRGSTGRGLRITSQSGFAVGDYMMVGAEIIKVAAMPRGPDDDFTFEGFDNQRLTYFDTTAEAHANARLPD